MKFLDILKNANQNLFRNKARSILTILAIFVGSFTIILNSAINTGVNTFIDEQVSSYGGEGLIHVTTASMSEQTSSLAQGASKVQEYNPDKNSSEVTYLSQSDIDKISKVDGIKNVTSIKYPNIEYIASSKTDTKYQLMAQGIYSESINVDVEAGRNVNMLSDNYEIVLPPDYPQALGYDNNEGIINQKVTLAVNQPTKCMVTPDHCTATVEATVVGVQAPGVVSLGSAWMNDKLTTDLYNLYTIGMPDATKNQIMMAAADIEPDKLSDIKNTLKDMGYEVTTVEDIVGTIKSFFDIILIVFSIFGYIALLAAAIGIINTLLMSVQERTREIGLNKALGMSSGRVFATFSLEAIMLGFWGSLIGICMAMLVGFPLDSAFHMPGGLFESLPTMHLVKFTFANTAPIVLTIMVIAFLAGTIPAVKAARKNPIDALRYE